MAVRIGELLLKEKLITPDQLQQALTHQKSNGGKLGFNLVKMGFVKDEQITALLSKQYGVPAINLAQFKIDPTIIKLVPTETARKYQIIPLSRSGSTLTIAMTDPTNVFAMDDIKFMTGYTVEPVVASEVAITDAIEKYYPSGKGGAAARGGAKGGKPGRTAPATGSTLEMASRGLEELQNSLGAGADDVEVLEELQEISAEALARQGEDAPVVRLVNVVLMSAIQKGASDIHIEPYEKELRVRYRIDGILYNIMAPPMKYRDAIVVARQDHVEARHRREAAAAGRPHQDPLQRERRAEGDRLPRLGAADAVRREDRPSSPRQGQADARHDPARLRARVARQVRAGDPAAVGHGAGHRPDRQRQDEHALLVDLEDQHARDQHHDRRGPGRVQPRRHQPGPGQGEHRPQLRRGAALLPASGSQHHPGRRNPRLRDRGNRGQGGAHRPPRALHAPHQRRARARSTV